MTPGNGQSSYVAPPRGQDLRGRVFPTPHSCRPRGLQWDEPRSPLLHTRQDPSPRSALTPLKLTATTGPAPS